MWNVAGGSGSMASTSARSRVMPHYTHSGYIVNGYSGVKAEEKASAILCVHSPQQHGHAIGIAAQAGRRGRRRMSGPPNILHATAPLAPRRAPDEAPRHVSTLPIPP